MQLSDGSIGATELFIQLEKPYLYMKKYEMVKSYGHFLQVRQSEIKLFRSCDEIRRKLIYLNFMYSGVSFVEIITIEPNPFEGTYNFLVCMSLFKQF